MKTNDKLTPLAVAAGAIGLIERASEQAHAIGRFHSTLREVRPGSEAAFQRMMAEIARLDRGALHPTEIEAARQRCEMPYMWAARKVAALKAECEADLMRVVREEDFANLVTTVGKNFLLDNGLAGSAYTAAFYMGLISSASYSAVNAADTMASHAGWLEAGATNAPTYSGSRKTAAWSAASAGSKSLSAGLVFTFTGTGTVKGCFLTTNNTVDGTTGTLYSAGLFTGGDQPVVSTNTLTVSYTASL